MEMSRRWIFRLLLIAFLWLIVTHFAQIEALAATLARGDWRWLLAAALLQILYYLVFTSSYRSALATAGVRSTLRDLLPVTLAALFVNVVTPAGGITGAALYVDDATRRGQSPSRTAAGLLLQLAADYTAFAIILIAGLAYLFRRHDLQAYEIAAALILLLITLGLTAILLLGLARPESVHRLLSRLERFSLSLAQRFARLPHLPEGWAARNASEFVDASAAIAGAPAALLTTLLLTFTAHLLDLSLLYVLFRAFHQPVAFGVLVAGYAVGVLFWIVALTPQGIGVVEGVMALVYTSLGVPAAAAAAIALAFRGLTFWLPLLLGFLALRGVKAFSQSERQPAEGWGVRLIAILTAAMGVINVLSAVTPSLMRRIQAFEKVLPLEVRRGGHLTAALAGFALLILASGLWRRKRISWLLTLAVLLVSGISHLVKGLDYEEALLALALGAALIGMRHQFHARSDPPSIRQGLTTLLWAMLFTLFYGVAGFYLLDRHYSVNFGLWAALRQTVVMFTQFYDPGLEPITGFGRYFAASIYVISAVTFGYALLMLVRPVIVRQPATRQERERARQIVEAYGCSSLARMALFPDKSYYFSPGGSLVDYVARGRAAVALGDVIGPQEDSAAAIQGFQEYCARNDWQPAFYQVQPDQLDLYRRCGFDALLIGQEAIVDLHAFTLEGKASKPLRAPVNHLTRLGCRAEMHLPPLSDDLLRELRAISDEWLAARHANEKRFSLGWFDDDYIRGSRVMAVHLPDGSISAFANVIPEFQKNEANIDLMRHRSNAEPGTMDFLFVSLLQWAKEQGYDTFNLGLSALAGVGDEPGDPAVERALHYVYEHINQFYNFKGLHAFKEKFGPSWSPRYLIYPGAASLPAVVFAMLQADSAEPALVRLFKRPPRAEAARTPPAAQSS